MAAGSSFHPSTVCGGSFVGGWPDLAVVAAGGVDLVERHWCWDEVTLAWGKKDKCSMQDKCRERQGER